jgi:tetratricopeptide (TPR) repeat protein
MSSEQLPQKLATGARVSQEEISGNRMRFTKVSGSGPQTGWVSLTASGEDLLVKENDAVGGKVVGTLTKAADIFKQLKDEEAAKEVLKCLASAGSDYGNSDEAVKAADEMIHLVRNSKDDSALGAACLLKSEVCLESGRSREAAKAAREAQKSYSKCGAKKEEAQSYLAIAYAEMNNEYGEAPAAARAAASLYRSMNDKDGQAGATYTLASAHLALLAIKQRTCVVPSKADTTAAMNAAREAHELYRMTGNAEGQTKSNEIVRTILAVNGSNDSPMLTDSSGGDEIDAGSWKYQKEKKAAPPGGVEFNHSKFSWRDATASNHYTLVWELEVKGLFQNKNAAYKAQMISKAARSVAMPMYHCLKNSFNAAAGNEGPMMIHMNAMNSSWEYGTAMMASINTVAAMAACKLTKLVFMQVGESPPGAVDERNKCRQVYMSPVTLSILRTARLEMPNMTLGYIALDAVTWHSNRSEVIASLPDVLQSEESEVHFTKGTPIAPCIVQRPIPPQVGKQAK